MNAITTTPTAKPRTYGKARLRGGKWHIQVEPHVAMRLKRVLGRVKANAVGVIVLKNTDEICMDLQWFMQRYPLDVLPLDALESRAKRYKATGERFAMLVAGEAQPQHFELAEPPRDYQRIAAEAMLRMRGLLLADQMGLGKTISAIAALSDPRTRPALVVTLAALPEQWESQINRFCPQLRTHVLRRKTPYDVRAAGQFPDVLITTYAKLTGWAESLAGNVRSVTFDECQELRHCGTTEKPVYKYVAAQLIASKSAYRWGLSGTPIYNYGEEFLNVFDILQPGKLGERDEFVTEWCGRDAKTGKAVIDDPKAFGSYLREGALMLRRTRKDVGRELPRFQRMVQPCDVDDKALKDIDSVATTFARQILAKETSWSDRGNAHRQFDFRMRQATGLAKAKAVCSLVRMLVESGEPVLVFAWHRGVHDLYAEYLKDFNPRFFTGKESLTEKHAGKTAFVKGESKVLVMSLRAGAGLDGLQFGCRTVVFGELDWSPGIHEQNEARIYRDGQPDPVSAYYLVSESGSDPIVSDVLGVKRWQLTGALDPKQANVVRQVEGKDEAIRRLAAEYLRRKGIALPDSGSAGSQQRTSA